ncbi:hypothetical protein ABTY61_32455 [Kitasatospora sp. NPDC096128]|uniref:hypothetical protein n=1 Tax=Kitasatospora sp. NPDC096128 TaxID=3155547 RepID=UPI00332DC19B
MPTPRSARPHWAVAVLLLDRPAEQVLLSYRHGRWTPPLTCAPARTACPQAALRAARHWWGLPRAQLAAVAGAARTAALGLPAHLALVLAPAGYPLPLCGPGPGPWRWWPVAALQHEPGVRPRELAAFLDGYLQGWLPDGTHTLCW